MSKKRRFKHFNLDELYILKRQAIESSYEILMSGRYPAEQGERHANLTQEIIEEIRRRGVRDEYDSE